MAMSRWRREARRVVAATLAALPADATARRKRQALRAAYPFGPREHHPYRVWCSEVRAALGLGPPGERPDRKTGLRKGTADDADAGPTLFD